MTLTATTAVRERWVCLTLAPGQVARLLARRFLGGQLLRRPWLTPVGFLSWSRRRRSGDAGGHLDCGAARSFRSAWQ